MVIHRRVSTRPCYAGRAAAMRVFEGMRTMSRRKTKSIESVTPGSYTGLPHAVLDSTAYTGLGFSARALLVDMARQLNGRNNGQIHCVFSWLAKRGWTSKATVVKARAELLERGLLVLTRTGGLNMGASLYGLTWLAIGDFTKLDISQRDYYLGRWRLMDKPPVLIKEIKNANAGSESGPVNDLHVHKMNQRNENRSRTGSESGRANATLPPLAGSEYGHNVLHHTVLDNDGSVMPELATQDQHDGYERISDDQHADAWDSDTGEFIQATTDKLRKGRK